MELSVDHFLGLSAALFIIGLMGVLMRRNVLIIFLCVELMVAAVSITFAAFARETNTLEVRALRCLPSRWLLLRQQLDWR